MRTITCRVSDQYEQMVRNVLWALREEGIIKSVDNE
jgi:hypothetical protein